MGGGPDPPLQAVSPQDRPDLALQTPLGRQMQLRPLPTCHPDNGTLFPRPSSDITSPNKSEGNPSCHQRGSWRWGSGPGPPHLGEGLEQGQV